MTTNQITDELILEKLKNPAQKEQVFRLILQKYQERLYWHVRRMVFNHEDANDVVQNTLIKIYQNIAKFKGNSKLYTWLYRIATNESITFLNKRKRLQAHSIDDEDYALSNQLKADPYFNGDEIERKLKAAIASLPQKQAAVFNLRYYEEMPYKDMSEVLETSVGALKASYHHAVKKIEHFFKED